MLNSRDAVANVAVKDLRKAKKFYENTLGLLPIESDEDVVVFESGASKLNVYRSEYAGTNKATAVTWAVEGGNATISGQSLADGVASVLASFPDVGRSVISALADTGGAKKKIWLEIVARDRNAPPYDYGLGRR